MEFKIYEPEPEPVREKSLCMMTSLCPTGVVEYLSLKGKVKNWCKKVYMVYMNISFIIIFYFTINHCNPSFVL